MNRTKMLVKNVKLVPLHEGNPAARQAENAGGKGEVLLVPAEVSRVLYPALKLEGVPLIQTHPVQLWLRHNKEVNRKAIL